MTIRLIIKELFHINRFSEFLRKITKMSFNILQENSADKKCLLKPSTVANFELLRLDH